MDEIPSCPRWSQSSISSLPPHSTPEAGKGNASLGKQLGPLVLSPGSGCLPRPLSDVRRLGGWSGVWGRLTSGPRQVRGGDTEAEQYLQ